MNQTTQPNLSHSDYHVGWICALPLELTAALAMLDEQHSRLSQELGDDNVYHLGSIGDHNVVMACLPAGQIGNNSAAMVAAQMRSTFPAIRFGLMVGIGGGAPSAEHDIRLGGVVVSRPGRNDGGVIQYDFGRTVESGRFVRTGVLNAPPASLLNAVNALEATQALRGHRLNEFLSVFASTPHANKYKYQGDDHDLLFEADYDHVENEPTCERCDTSRRVKRHERGEGLKIHYGTIASGNQIIRHGVTRERWREESGVLCFEMEAAGLMNTFQCIVIRGICDYADSHKNKRWQEYAAATAAAYAKELLMTVPPTEPPAYSFSSPTSSSTVRGGQSSLVMGQENNDWLLIFDNADDSTFPYADWIPPRKDNVSMRRMLFTTRDERLAHAVAGVNNEVLSMDLGEALELFYAGFGGSLENSGRSSTNLDALVQRLEKLPLAISLASAYLREYPWVSVDEYIKQINTLSERPQIFNYKQAFSNYGHPIMSSWEISFARVEADNRDAACVLTLLGFLANNLVKFEFFEDLSTKSLIDELGFLQNITEVKQALGLLRALCLLYFDGSMISIHPLVHEWIQARLGLEDLEHWSLTALRAIYYAHIADVFPPNGAITITEACKAHTSLVAT
ncbi:nucleoside phosphorylase domain-containing protein [Aspergillus heterothallicus]